MKSRAGHHNSQPGEKAKHSLEEEDYWKWSWRYLEVKLKMSGS